MFFIFSYLIALSSASTIMLNRGGKGNHLCLVPDLRRKMEVFPPIGHDVTCKFGVDGLHHVEEISFCI
jgi:hypothetical protein